MQTNLPPAALGWARHVQGTVASIGEDVSALERTLQIMGGGRDVVPRVPQIVADSGVIKSPDLAHLRTFPPDGTAVYSFGAPTAMDRTSVVATSVSVLATKVPGTLSGAVPSLRMSLILTTYDGEVLSSVSAAPASTDVAGGAGYLFSATLLGGTDGLALSPDAGGLTMVAKVHGPPGLQQTLTLQEVSYSTIVLGV